MCGVVGLIYGSDNSNMGREGSELLKRLEYRDTIPPEARSSRMTGRSS
jgi:hypothetical protein